MKIIKELSKKYNLHYLRFFILYVILSIAFAIFSVLIEQTSGGTANAAVSLDLNTLKSMLLWMALFTAAKIIFDALRTYISGRSEAKSAYKMRGSYANYFTRLDYKQLGKKSSGDILSLFSNDLPEALALLTGEFLSIVSGILLLITGAVFMFRIHALNSLIFFLLFPLLTLIQIKVSKPIEPLAVKSSVARGEFNGVVNDSLQNTSIVLAYNLQEDMEERYLESYKGFYEAEKHYISVFVRLIISGILASFIPVVFITLAGGIAVIKGQIDVGQFIVIVSLGATANEMLTMLSQNLARFQREKAAAKRLLENTETEAGESQRSEAVFSGEGIIIDKLSFSYDGENNVLNEISLEIPPGSNIALVGKSGCGKSTLAKIILGLYHGETGSITRPSRENSGDICSSIAYVPQDSFLFPDTIVQNIVCSENNDKIDMDRVIASAKAAGIHSFIDNMPDKYGSMLLPDAQNLSGGQKQRIAIARALYSDRPVLLLDEATSSLDPATETAVLKEIYKACEGKILITVAHRLAAVKDCDCIFYMENGTIAEKGAYDELMEKGAKFYALYENQQIQEEGTGNE